MYKFKSAQGLLKLCAEHNISISEVMLRREMELGEVTREQVMEKVDRALRVMEMSTEKPIEEPADSMGGLIGGEARKLNDLDQSQVICGRALHLALINALAVAETNSTMGVIVAAPTAGAAGVLPACLLAIYDSVDISVETMRKGLINASAIGYLATRNGSVSGAEAGCQAEVGTASAMAASALAEMLGGTPSDCCNAAAIALSNLLGLVCDPVRGLVEVPCQTRNTIGVAGAFSAAELALAGIKFPVPLDKMIELVDEVGGSLPESLRETGKGGCAAGCAGCQTR